MGKNIRTIKNKWGLKGEAFLKLLDSSVSTQTLTAWMKGDTPPSISTLVVLSDSCGISVQDLIRRELKENEIPPLPIKSNEAREPQSGYRSTDDIISLIARLPEMMERIEGLERLLKSDDKS